MSEERPRTVAFYLPQYHQIPENDAWWGDDFTDWVNVRRARPLFTGHDQPRVPTELGYYDPTELGTIRRQVELARSADVDAFCIYFYWFDGRRLLERPTEIFRSSDIDFPYCLCWANESWTRRWDGKEADVLMPQRYEDGFEEEVFRALAPHFKQSNYMTQVGKPILVVHRVDQIPEAKKTTDTWRRLALEEGLPGLYLVAAETKPNLDPRRFGFDAAAEFPPVGSNTVRSALTRPVQVSPSFAGRLLSYERMAKRFLARSTPPFALHRGVAPGWDNTARRGRRATVYLRSSPRSFAKWLAAARADEARRRGRGGLVFVNAWNEWAEGAYLEPDATFGFGYLEATRWGADPASLPGASHFRGGPWTFSQTLSMGRLVAGSVLAAFRRLFAYIARRLAWAELSLRRTR